jgi:hypothetical protein
MEIIELSMQGIWLFLPVLHTIELGLNSRQLTRSAAPAVQPLPVMAALSLDNLLKLHRDLLLHLLNMSRQVHHLRV